MSEQVMYWFDLCIWKDLYKNRAILPVPTTFGECDNWDSTHPLYPCIECDGLTDGCIGYKPLSKIGKFR